MKLQISVRPVYELYSTETFEQWSVYHIFLIILEHHMFSNSSI